MKTYNIYILHSKLHIYVTIYIYVSVQFLPWTVVIDFPPFTTLRLSIIEYFLQRAHAVSKPIFKGTGSREKFKDMDKNE